MTAKHILIVEDETVVQLHLQRIVEESGHIVVGTAATIEAALAIAAVAPPDLVLLDVHLPGVADGVEVGRILREKFGTALVFVTAYADDATIQRIVDVGAVGYVVKPFSPAEIRAVLSTALRGHKSLQDLQARARTLDSILSRVGDAVVATDVAGCITHWSDPMTALTGLRAVEAMGRHVVAIVRCRSQREVETFTQWVEKSLSGAEEVECTTLEILDSDNRERMVMVRAERLLEGEDTPGGLVVVFHEPTRVRRRSNGDGKRPAALRRVFLYSHDTLGLGHLQRSLNVSRGLLQEFSGLSVLLATGSPVAHRFHAPAGADFLKLPAVKKVAPERYEARSLDVSDGDILQLRTNLLLRAVRDFDPDLVLVDHAPLGMGGEMRPSLEWLEANTSCVKLLGLRDITDDPKLVIPTWKEQDAYGAMLNLYDHIIVYGSPNIFNVVDAYALPLEVARKTHYVGYVCETTDASEPEHVGVGVEDLPRPLVVVTIGGGDGASDTLVGNYIEMVRRFASRIDFWSMIVTGPLLGAEATASLRSAASGLPITLREFVPSTAPYFRHADLVVATGGYNTIAQALRLADRAVVVPRILHRKEQLMRAERLAELGLVDCIHPDRVSPESLFSVVSEALANPRRPLAEGRAAAAVPLDGALRLAEFCRSLFPASVASVESISALVDGPRSQTVED